MYFCNNSVTLTIPKTIVYTWCTTNLVSSSRNVKSGPHVMFVCNLQPGHVTVMMTSLMRPFCQPKISDKVTKWKPPPPSSQAAQRVNWNKLNNLFYFSWSLFVRLSNIRDRKHALKFQIICMCGWKRLILFYNTKDLHNSYLFHCIWLTEWDDIFTHC